MSIPKFNDLFHDSGAQGILNLLLSKLEANDLSTEEALAMLSAVHEELGQGSNTGPKVYKSYTDFLKNLQRVKPEIYDHVVSSWNRRNQMGSSEETGQDENIEDNDTIASNPQEVEAGADEGFVGVKLTGGGADEEEETQESGEPEEEENTEAQKTVEGGDDLKNQGTEKEDDENTEEDESDQKEGKDEELEETDEDEINDREEDLETSEPQEENTEEVEEESDLGEGQSELDEEAEPDEVDNASTPEAEKGEPAGDTGGEQAENEWPEIAESEAEEPLKGFDEEDGPSPGVD
jgi:hypothetical protein